MTDLQNKSPELRVIHSTGNIDIKINGESPVFLINGRIRSQDRIINLTPERIQRIEMTTYSDIRYGSPVINIILKPATYGGNLSLYSQQAVTTPKVYSTASGSFNYDKSQIVFDYRLIYRKSNKEYTSNNESYIAPDLYVMRDSEGLPSGTVDQDHRFRLDYTYTPNRNSVFSLSGDMTIHRNRYTYGELYQQTVNGNVAESFKGWTRRHYLQTPFGFSGFYRTKMGKSTFELSTSVARNKGDYDRTVDYSTGYYSESGTSNSATTSGTEIVYSFQPLDNLSFDLGSNYTYTYSNSNFIQNDESLSSTSKSHKLYFYSKVHWGNKGFFIDAGPGLRYYATKNGKCDDSYWRMRGVISVSQRFTKHFNGYYTYSVDPSYPSLSDYTTIRQTIDDYSYQVGNPDLETSLTQNHSLRLSYWQDCFSVSPYVRYQQQNKPILTIWEYSPTEQMFVKTIQNGKYTKQLDYGLSISVNNLFKKKISLSADLSYNQFWVNTTEGSVSRGRLDLRFYGSAYFGPFSIYLNLTPIRGLGFNPSSYTYYRQLADTYIGISYRYKHFQFGLQSQNLFAKKANFIQTYHLSKIHPRYEEYCIKNFNNMILFSIQYLIDFGHKYTKPNINSHRVNTEKNIVTEY